jgi:Ca2+-binding EF-hand superfamily protein
MISSKATGGSLACDPFTASGFANAEYETSITTDNNTAMARNTFVIESAKGGPVENGEPICYGVPFRIRCNNSLLLNEKTNMLQPPLYLASVLKSERKASPISNKQLVYMTPKANYDTVWIAMTAAVDKDSGAARLLIEGERIPANSEVVIQHCGTKQLLCADVKNSFVSDFGTEYEVSGNTSFGVGRTSVLAGEFSGRRTGNTNVKPEHDQNIFAFVTSYDPIDGVDDRVLPPPLSAEGLIAKVLEVMRKRSNNAVRNLRSAFRAMDKEGDFRLDKEDMKWGLIDLGVKLDDEQYALLFSHFDESRDGLISMTEFMTAIRGEMNDYRREVVMAAYDVLDRDGSGMVTVEDMMALYDMSADVMVAEGRKTIEEASREFMATWEVTPDGMLTREEFLEYYKDLSAEIQEDEEFEAIVRAAWGF